MEKRRLWTTIGVMTVFLIGAAWLYATTPSRDAILSPYQGEPEGVATGSEASYTLAEVATHNNRTSCWAAVSGEVYDLTQWVGQHPGGDRAILSICGFDGTESFSAMHGSDPNAMKALEEFVIGTLKE